MRRLALAATAFVALAAPQLATVMTKPVDTAGRASGMSPQAVAAVFAVAAVITIASLAVAWRAERLRGELRSCDR
jgi:hypothetical protein